MAGDGVEAAHEAETVSPTRKRLTKRRRNNSRPDNHQWKILLPILQHLTLHLDQELLRHSLGIAIIIWKLANNGTLILDNLFVTHLQNILVLLLPNMRRLLHLLVDEADLVTEGEAG